MKTATIHEIKQELLAAPEKELVNLCLKLAKFRKENKELLTYLLFEAHNEEGYIAATKELIGSEFEQLEASTNLYFAKKTIRKILRIANKHIRYTGSKQAEAAILLHFCSTLKQHGIPFEKSTALNNLYGQQIKKITVALNTLHEDLQYDFRRELEAL
ncbi:MAG TPA: hypothetical protein VJ552_08250 [Sediminibacterium sp.]|nr:hypothetical protein [Sediminibacterium sp.]